MHHTRLRDNTSTISESLRFHRNSATAAAEIRGGPAPTTQGTKSYYKLMLWYLYMKCHMPAWDGSGYLRLQMTWVRPETHNCSSWVKSTWFVKLVCFCKMLTLAIAENYEREGGRKAGKRQEGRKDAKSRYKRRKTRAKVLESKILALLHWTRQIILLSLGFLI